MVQDGWHLRTKKLMFVTDCNLNVNRQVGLTSFSSCYTAESVISETVESLKMRPGIKEVGHHGESLEVYILEVYILEVYILASLPTCSPLLILPDVSKHQLPRLPHPSTLVPLQP